MFFSPLFERLKQRTSKKGAKKEAQRQQPLSQPQQQQPEQPIQEQQPQQGRHHPARLRQVRHRRGPARPPAVPRVQAGLRQGGHRFLAQQLRVQLERAKGRWQEGRGQHEVRERTVQVKGGSVARTSGAPYHLRLRGGAESDRAAAANARIRVHHWYTTGAD